MNAGKMSAITEILTHYQNALLGHFLKQIETLLTMVLMTSI